MIVALNFEITDAKYFYVQQKMLSTNLYIDISSNQWPIIYRPEYNVRFMGLERLHPFDSKKWGNIFKYLKNADILNEETVTKPNEATMEDLLVVHSKKYLKSLKCSFNVACIAEILPLALVPNYWIQRGYLKPMRYQTGGTVLAGKLALERGWAINIGGGFHHCCANKGGGFCVYADITLLIHFVLIFYPQRANKFMIIDLDAHQGNGHERDFIDNPSVYILDVYNKGIYPFDETAKSGIRRSVPLNHGTGDDHYLHLVERHIDCALQEFSPDLIVYNAGTDILMGDPLGALAISPQGVVKRDELVFKKASERGIPIVMLTSGGYLKKSAKIIACSIINLHDVGLINGPHMKY